MAYALQLKVTQQKLVSLKYMYYLISSFLAVGTTEVTHEFNVHA